MIVFFFVNDIVVLYNKFYTNKVDTFQAQVFLTYKIRNIGEVEWFLGIWITHDRQLQQIQLYQDSYIDKLMIKYNINLTNKPPATLLSNYNAFVKHNRQASPQQILIY